MTFVQFTYASTVKVIDLVISKNFVGKRGRQRYIREEQTPLRFRCHDGVRKRDKRSGTRNRTPDTDEMVVVKQYAYTISAGRNPIGYGGKFDG